MTGMHTPGRTGVWERYLDEVEKDRPWPTVPAAGRSASPDTVREFLRGYEESGVDEIILLLNPRSHEGTMESIEIMGKEVLPEFIERDEKAVAEKAKRLEPVIEKVEARREASTAPTFDESYSFGGLPTGRGGKFTASEIPEAMAEINEGRVAGRAAKAEKDSSASEKPAPADEDGDPWARSTNCGATTGGASVVTGCASGIGAARGASARRTRRRGRRARRAAARRASSTSSTTSTCPTRHRSTRPSRRSAAGSTRCSTSPACRRASATRCGWSRSTSSAPGISPRRCVPPMPPGSAIVSVSSLAASEYRENAAVTAGLLDTATMAEGIEWCERNPEALAEAAATGCPRRRSSSTGWPTSWHWAPAASGSTAPAPGVTETPILDQLRNAYGQDFLDAFRTPLGRVADPDEQASVLVFLNSGAASYITGQVIWVDGGNDGETDLAGSVPRR